MVYGPVVSASAHAESSDCQAVQKARNSAGVELARERYLSIGEPVESGEHDREERTVEACVNASQAAGTWPRSGAVKKSRSSVGGRSGAGPSPTRVATSIQPLATLWRRALQCGEVLRPNKSSFRYSVGDND